MNLLNNYSLMPFDYLMNISSRRPQEGASGEPNQMPEQGQWTCYKCFINNFNGRSNCFKCGTLRFSGEALALNAKGLSMVGALPCDTLLLRELPATATDASVRRAVVRFACVVPLRVRLAVSRKFAFIQMASLVDAEVAQQKLQRICLYIDNCAVLVSFSCHSLDKILSDGRVQLLPETQQTDAISVSRQSPSHSAINTPFGILPTFPIPDPTRFQYEPSTSYYYDQSTGFYYDPKTEFYYSPKSKSWKFWCSKYCTYIDCEGGDIALKSRLQEDANRSDAQTHDDAAPLSETEHRRALHNAPPPPNRAAGGEGRKSVIAGATPAAKTRSGSNRRPLLLELEDDDDDEPIQTIGIGRVEQQQHDERKTMPGSNNNSGGPRSRKQQRMVGLHKKTVEEVNQQDREILTLNPPKTVPPLSSNGGCSNAALLGTLRESMRLNHVMIAQLSDQRSVAKERNQIVILQSQIDALMTHQKTLGASIEQLICSASSTRIVSDNEQYHQNSADFQRRRSGPISSVQEMPRVVVTGGGVPLEQQRSEPRATPQLKRHITRERPHEMGRRSPSIVELDARDGGVSSPNRRHSSAKRPAFSPPSNMVSSSWRDKSTDLLHPHHDYPHHNQAVSPPITRENLGQLVSALVKRGIDEEWRNLRKRRSPTRSESPRHGKRDEHWREGRENDRRSRRDDRRSRSRDRSREHRRVHESRHQQLHGQEPMTIASPSPPSALFEGNSWMSPPIGNRAMPLPETPSFSANPPGVPPLMSPAQRFHSMLTPNMPLNLIRHGHPINAMPQFMPRTPNMFHDMTRHNNGHPPFNASPQHMPEFEMAESPLVRTPSLGPLSEHNRPAPVQMSTPGVPPGYGRDPKQFFTNPLRAQQLRYPAALSSAAARAMPASAFGSPGGTPFNKRVPSIVVVNELDNAQLEKKSQLISKERTKVNSLGICLNCGRYGHSQFQCRWNRISDDELQKKLRDAKTRLQRQELDKEELKRRAEKYPLRRKDPLVERLRVAAPEGKIKMEHIRMLCPKCAHFNHTRMECSRPDIGRTLHKQIFTQLEEFKKVFFVHLQEDNMIDLSQKFDTFRIMNGIEQNGTIDPVGLQLLGMCPDGIVTQMDLRELCSNCAQLGHKRTECPEKAECSRTHFDKMLALVKAYRALVKEGSGNFVLPNARMMNPPVLVLKDIERSEPVEEIILVDSSDDEDTVMVEERMRTTTSQQQQEKGKRTDGERTDNKPNEEENKQNEEERTQQQQQEGTKGTADNPTILLRSCGEDDDVMVEEQPTTTTAQKQPQGEMEKERDEDKPNEEGQQKEQHQEEKEKKRNEDNPNKEEQQKEQRKEEKEKEGTVSKPNILLSSCGEDDDVMVEEQPTTQQQQQGEKERTVDTSNEEGQQKEQHQEEKETKRNEDNPNEEEQPKEKVDDQQNGADQHQVENMEKERTADRPNEEGQTEQRQVEDETEMIIS